jgi:ATP-dependent Clp protease adaptor protein ClpS
MLPLKANTDPLQQEDVDVLTSDSVGYNLIVWNDEVNTFEWVITTLVEICQHTTEQAEQCALLIHTQGKYAVKQGTFETLKPMCEAICDRGINATIEKQVS